MCIIHTWTHLLHKKNNTIAAVTTNAPTTVSDTSTPAVTSATTLTVGGSTGPVEGSMNSWTVTKVQREVGLIHKQVINHSCMYVNQA